jgi:hypothetical protein
MGGLPQSCARICAVPQQGTGDLEIRATVRKNTRIFPVAAQQVTLDDA